MLASALPVVTVYHAVFTFLDFHRSVSRFIAHNSPSQTMRCNGSVGLAEGSGVVSTIRCPPDLIENFIIVVQRQEKKGCRRVAQNLWRFEARCQQTTKQGTEVGLAGGDWTVYGC